MLIAARGEVAVRIARAARELGWEPITVYEEGDRHSPHVKAGVTALPVESYTSAESIVEAAIKAGADILHPGYGFLSESPEFAEKVLAAGISWAGPSPDAMRRLGDKHVAKSIAEKLGVPTLSWCEARSADEAVRCAERIGYPVILKASLAGGGRGSRVAYTAEEVARSYRLVKAEAGLGFGGSGAIFVERYVPGVRHIEVQILGDGRGSILHLYERECSLQRRRQKIVEEAPSPFVEKARRSGLRERLTSYALRLAEAVDYESAGTVEFLVDRQARAYFIEANTRLQVEHGVTEEVTGVDIVKAQLLVAAGRPLPYRQEDIRLHGWAIEARLYAESPEAGFRAAEGVVKKYREPRGPGIRVDSAVEEGMRVAPGYDTLLAKIIVRGLDRSEAVSRLRWALREAMVSGVETNLELLRVIADQPWFSDGEYDTGIIESSLPQLLSEARRRRALVGAIARAVASDTELYSQGSGGERGYAGYGWPWPPWRSGWRL